MDFKQKLLMGIGLITLGIGILTYSKDQTNKKSYSQMAKEINQDANSSWEANENITEEEILKLKGQFNLIIEKELPSSFDQWPLENAQEIKLPKSFDSRVKWPKCSSIKEIRDQSACGSCWAFGAASAMSDRICIHSGQEKQTRISTEDIVECCHSCGFGCEGGYLYQTWSYWKSVGVVTGGMFKDNKTCKPYVFPPCNHHSEGPFEDCSTHHYKTPACKKKCSNPNYKTSYERDKNFGKSIYSFTGEEKIMKEVVQNGPIEVAFSVYQDFLLYKKGIYVHTTGDLLGGHAVKLIGYGEENGIKYWLIANSWNKNWGEQGFFRILRGEDHCNIETNVVAGIPK